VFQPHLGGETDHLLDVSRGQAGQGAQASGGAGGQCGQHRHQLLQGVHRDGEEQLQVHTHKAIQCKHGSVHGLCACGGGGGSSPEDDRGSKDENSMTLQDNMLRACTAAHRPTTVQRLQTGSPVCNQCVTPWVTTHRDHLGVDTAQAAGQRRQGCQRLRALTPQDLDGLIHGRHNGVSAQAAHSSTHSTAAAAASQGAERIQGLCQAKKCGELGP
jgi:hypothetical protein